MDIERTKIEFGEVYDKYLESIFRFAYIRTSSKLIAEDITSEVFAKYWQAMQKKEIKNPRAFLYECARNSIVDFFRKNNKAQIISTDFIPEVIDETKTPQELAQFANDMGQIIQAMSSLGHEQQEAIEWYYLEGLTIPEIARHLKKSDGAVRTMISRGLELIRKGVKES